MMMDLHKFLEPSDWEKGISFPPTFSKLLFDLLHSRFYPRNFVFEISLIALQRLLLLFGSTMLVFMGHTTSTE